MKNRTILLALGILFFSICGTARASGVAAFRSEIDFAQKFMEDGFYDMAEEKLIEILLSDVPDELQAEVHLLLGKVYYDTDQAEKALAEFGMVRDRSRSRHTGLEAAAIFWIAETYYSQGSYEKAIEEYQAVILAYPAGEIAERAHYAIAWCYEKMGEYQAAVAAFKDIVARYPDKEFALLAGQALGDVLFRTGRFSEAVVELESHIAKYPVNARVFESYYVLGESYYALGNLGKASACFKRSSMVQSSEPWKNVAEFKIAEISRSPGDNADAIEWFKKVVDSDFNTELRTSALMEIAAIEDGSEAYDVAIETYLRVIRDTPENPKTRVAYLHLAELYFRLGRFENSAALCREALLRYPRGEVSDRIRYVLAKAYRDFGKMKRALDEFYQIAEVSTDQKLASAALVEAADILKNLGDLISASEVYDRVLTDHPDSKMADYAQYEIGAIMEATGGKNSAILAFQSMIINFPDSRYLDRVYYRLGELYSERGDNYSALENFNKVIDIYPESGLRIESLLKKANSLYRMGRYEEALAVCRLVNDELVQRGGENNVSFLRISDYCSGWTSYRLGLEDAAYHIFSRMMDDNDIVDGLTPGVIFWFGEYFYGKGDFDLAREYFLRVTKEFPRSNFARDAEYWMGWVLYDDNMLEESLQQFIKVATSSSSDKWVSQATLTLGDIYKKRGEIEDAIRNYKNVAGAYKGTGIANIANNRIGIILKSREEYVLAMEYFRMAVTGDNTETNAQIQFDLAECYERSGDEIRALEEYLKVEYRYPAGEFWLMRSRIKCAELFESRGDLDKAYKMHEKLSRGTGKEAEFARERMEWIKKKVQ